MKASIRIVSIHRDEIMARREWVFRAVERKPTLTEYNNGGLYYHSFEKWFLGSAV
jgi:hypothetical protein